MPSPMRSSNWGLFFKPCAMCLLIQQGFCDRPLQLLFLYRELCVVLHSLAEPVVHDSLDPLQIVVEVSPCLRLAELVRHGGVLLPFLESCQGLLQRRPLYHRPFPYLEHLCEEIVTTLLAARL